MPSPARRCPSRTQPTAGKSYSIATQQGAALHPGSAITVSIRAWHDAKAYRILASSRRRAPCHTTSGKLALAGPPSPTRTRTPATPRGSRGTAVRRVCRERDSHFLETAIRTVVYGCRTHRLLGLFVENSSATGWNSTRPIGLPPHGVGSCPTGNAEPQLGPSRLKTGAAELGLGVPGVGSLPVVGALRRRRS